MSTTLMSLNYMGAGLFLDTREKEDELERHLNQWKELRNENLVLTGELKAMDPVALYFYVNGDKNYYFVDSDLSLAVAMKDSPSLDDLSQLHHLTSSEFREKKSSKEFVDWYRFIGKVAGVANEEKKTAVSKRTEVENNPEPVTESTLVLDSVVESKPKKDFPKPVPKPEVEETTCIDEHTEKRCLWCDKIVTDDMIDAELAFVCGDRYFCDFDCYTDFVFSGKKV